MKKRYLLFSLAILFASTLTFAQVKQQSKNYLPNPQYPELFKTIPLINDISPEWVKLMYSESPNFYEVETAYEQFYRENEFKKTTHTQNFRYWSRIVGAEGYLQPDGSIYMPTPEENRKREILLKEKYENYSNRGITAGNWQCIGPFETYETDGITKKSAQVNIYCFSQSLSNSNVLYAGAEDGGVFKSVDKGLNWTVIAEDHSLGGIQVLEVDPTDDDIVYMATGERLYKTIDGGVTWAIMEDINDNNISDISIYPTNTQIVLTAGKLGLKRSTDGGATWTTIISDRCWDIELKTDDPNTVLVSKYNSTKVITEIWKSIDNGLTFAAKVTGWYDPLTGVASATDGARIGVTDADPNRVYVILLGTENDAVNDNNFIGIYRSDDAGETWISPYDGDGDGNPDNEPGGPYSDDHWCFTSFHPTFDWGGYYNQGFWDLAIGVSDTDEDKFLVGSLNLFKSEDGGVTYSTWGGYQCDNCTPGYRHPDQQEIEINGSDVWVASDGGIDIYDGDLNRIEARNNGMSGSNFWGFGQGWNEDVVTGGKYHNGNCAHHENYGNGNFIALGGGETPTGYVNQGENRKVQHSDISGKLIPAALTGGVSDIAKYSTFPNQAYISNNKSEIVTHPSSWNILYLGKDNKVLKSEDGGTSFNEIGTFGTVATDIVLGIEISRNNPEVIYAIQMIQWCAKLWKTTDGGTSWSEVAIPACTSSIFISVSASDENVIFLAVHNGSTNTNKIFKSTNGGTSWTNISDPIFDNETPKCIQVQDGTDGGVYVVTSNKVYYKNNTIGWQLFSDGLPAKMQYIGFLPFYRDGKVRLATMNRGIWESPFYESSSPIAQPMLSTTTSFCARDTLFFENYSICHSSATFSWSFSPAPQWVNSSNARNPKVKFGTSGTYSVTLTVTDANGTDSKIVNDIVTISAECDPETVPGNALDIPGGGSDYAIAPPLNITSNTITLSAWIKRDGDQNDFTGIIFSRGGSVGAGGLNFGTDNELRYHWDSGNWGWNSGLVVPDGVWTHVALVIEPTKATFYMNGEPSVHNSAKSTKTFDVNLNIGGDPGYSTRKFKGLMDEVCIYNASLTQQQIRDLMYKTKDPDSLPNLIHYYQFNRASGSITDRVALAHASLSGNATRTASTAPIPYNTIVDGNWSADATWNTGQNAPVKDWARAKVENDVNLDQNQTLKSLEITPTGKLSVNATQQLTMEGTDLVNDAGNSGLVIKSDITGSGSLIHNTENVDATVERFISQWADNVHGWHFLASPVETFNIVGSVFEPGADDDLYRWDEVADLWMNQKEGDPSQIIPGVGYLTAWETTTTKSFIGTLNSSDITLTNLSLTTANDFTGWHLLGNPYPCGLLWDATSWALNNVDGVAKIWDETNASYTDIAQNDAIPAMQGFMVNVSSASNSITIPLADRAHSITNWYKDAEANIIKLTAYDTEGGTAQESIIKFNENATTSFDSEFDSWFLVGYAPQFYSIIPEGNISTNTLPGISYSTIIPMSFIKNTSATYLIEAEGVANLVPQEKVYLTDLKTSYTQLLNDNPVYEFTSEEGDDHERFVVHFSPLDINEETLNDNIKIYNSDNNVEFRSMNQVDCSIMIYDITGKLIAEGQMNNESSKSITIPNYKGVVIVSVISQQTSFTEKVLIW